MEEHTSRKVRKVDIGIAYDRWQKERILRKLTNEKFALYLLSLLHQSTSNSGDLDFDNWRFKQHLYNPTLKTYSANSPRGSPSKFRSERRFSSLGLPSLRSPRDLTLGGTILKATVPNSSPVTTEEICPQRVSTPGSTPAKTAFTQSSLALTEEIDNGSRNTNIIECTPDINFEDMSEEHLSPGKDEETQLGSTDDQTTACEKESETMKITPQISTLTLVPANGYSPQHITVKTETDSSNQELENRHDNLFSGHSPQPNVSGPDLTDVDMPYAPLMLPEEYILPVKQKVLNTIPDTEENNLFLFEEQPEVETTKIKIEPLDVSYEPVHVTELNLEPSSVNSKEISGISAEDQSFTALDQPIQEQIVSETVIDTSRNNTTTCPSIRKRKAPFLRKDKEHLNDTKVEAILTALANGGESGSENSDVDYDDEVEYKYILSCETDNSIPHNGNEQIIQPDASEQQAQLNIDKTTKPKALIKWDKNKKFNAPTDIEWKGMLNQDRQNETVLSTPFEIFLKYFPLEFFEYVSEMTNRYSVQKQGTSINTNPEEIRLLFATHILMGILGFPQLYLYWREGTRIPSIADCITRKRFCKLRNNLHVVDTIADDKSETDRLWKVRPAIDTFQKRCKELSLEKNLCIDEQIIPFKGKLNIKQYIRGKPSPWGIKLFLLCGQSGIVYEALDYQGKTSQINSRYAKEFGLSAAVVLTLGKRIPEDQCFYIYFDKYFTTIPLLQALKVKGICAAGTIRKNRILRCPIPTKNYMNKMKQGSSVEICDSKEEIVVVAWKDNSAVLLASNYIGIGTQDVAKRWDKIDKKIVKVERPEIIKHYNASMGGVDKTDFLISLYRIIIRSRKWPLRVIFHLIDLGISNSWLEYKNLANEIELEPKKQLNLLQFRLEVCEALASAGIATQTRKRGIPSQASPVQNPKKPKKLVQSKKPTSDIRYDQIGHFPSILDKQQRCKQETCKGQTVFFCEKCQLSLCLVKTRNCFKKFHCL